MTNIHPADSANQTSLIPASYQTIVAKTGLQMKLGKAQFIHQPEPVRFSDYYSGWL